MATAATIISAAFQKIGIESPTTAQNTAALSSLNDLISLWGAEGLNYVPTRESFTVVTGDLEYTIGSGGQWDTTRPMKMRTCYLRDSDGYDTPINVKSARDYAAEGNKNYTAKPSTVYFIPEYPLAKIIFDSSPDTSYTVTFEFDKNLTEFSTSASTVDLPPEYREALIYNLAVSIAEDWDRSPSKTLYARAEQTKAIIDRFNATLRPVPKARFDFGVTGDVLNEYSIVNDSTIDGGAF